MIEKKKAFHNNERKQKSRNNTVVYETENIKLKTEKKTGKVVKYTRYKKRKINLVNPSSIREDREDEVSDVF